MALAKAQIHGSRVWFLNCWSRFCVILLAWRRWQRHGFTSSNTCMRNRLWIKIDLCRYVNYQNLNQRWLNDEFTGEFPFRILPTSKSVGNVSSFSDWFFFYTWKLSLKIIIVIELKISLTVSIWIWESAEKRWDLKCEGPVLVYIYIKDFFFYIKDCIHVGFNLLASSRFGLSSVSYGLGRQAALVRKDSEGCVWLVLQSLCRSL